jgi:drug/metabolite transporter (DMT)-like permease
VLMWRFVIAAPLLLGLSRRRGARVLSRQAVAVQLSIGLLSQGVYLTGNVLAVRFGVPAGTAALICAVQPILTAAFAGPILGEAVTWSQWCGLLIATIGVGLVVAGDLGASHHVPLWAYGLPVAAMAGLVGATLLQGHLRPAASLRQSLAIQSAGCAIIFTSLALATHSAVPPLRPAFWVAVVWFAFLSFAGYGLYWANMARAGATRVSTLISLTPPATAAWALAMFGQALSPDIAAGMGISLGGVLLAARSQTTSAALSTSEAPGSTAATQHPDRT